MAKLNLMVPIITINNKTVRFLFFMKISIIILTTLLFIFFLLLCIFLTFFSLLQYIIILLYTKNKKGMEIGMYNDLYNNLIKKVDEGNKCVVLTFLNSKNNNLKEKILLTKDDIDNKILPLDDFIYENINKSLSLESLLTISLNDNELLLIEPYFPKPRLIIFGGGHIAKPLCEFANRVGFSITVIDDRPYFANTERFPDAHEVICEDFAKSFDKINFRKNVFKYFLYYCSHVYCYSF